MGNKGLCPQQAINFFIGHTASNHDFTNYKVTL